MRISIIGVVKLVTLGVVLAFIVLIVLWARAKYAIQGRIYVEEGSAAGPARQIEVRLVNKNYEDTVARLAREFERAAEQTMYAAVTQLAGKVNDIPVATNRTRDAGELSLDELSPAEARAARATLQEEHPDVQRLVKALEKELGPLTDDERKEVSARVRRYLAFSLYCREVMPAAPLGSRFYERAAQYWEERAEQLKKTGRVIIDDAALSYVTEWMTGGLGDEPVQRVSRVSRTNEALRTALARAANVAKEPRATTPRKPAHPAPRTGGVLPHSSLTSNDLFAVVTATQRELQRVLEQTLRAAEEGLLDETLDLTTTDDDGRFVFRGETVQPGEYLIFAKYDIVTLEGDPVQLMWFEPLTISLRRFAFNKTTQLDLTELNQRRPAVMELRVPSADELRTTLLRRAAEAKALPIP